ncbi:peptidylprolyl isomerase [Candidatus Woesearchaeota archaeon]|nr:peptidylprolyl isomerase [Candidatus Woesearchaeota archaeon]
MDEKHGCAGCADKPQAKEGKKSEARSLPGPVKEGDCVSVNYKGTLEDGTCFDSSEGRDPLEFVVGSGQLIKGFDTAVIGMKPSEKKTINLEPADAYGQRDDNKVQEVPRDALPKDQEPKEGMMLIIGTPDGQRFPAAIKKVDAEKVTLDLNHPLAGKKLTFEIEVVKISDKPSSTGCGCCC